MKENRWGCADCERKLGIIYNICVKAKKREGEAETNTVRDTHTVHSVKHANTLKVISVCEVQMSENGGVGGTPEQKQEVIV